MTSPSILDSLAPVHWTSLVLISGRVVGLMLVAPLWSLEALPTSVRGALVVALSALLLPLVPVQPLPPDLLGLPVPVASELLLGLAIGLTGAVFMHGVAMAGEVAALQMGLNLGPALTPAAEGSVSGVGELMSSMALVLYATIGGHLALLAALAASFHAIPAGGLLNYAEGGHAVVSLAATVFSTAVRVVAPIMVALLLANLGLAILSRAVPQLNAMAVAFPVTIGIGLIVLGGSLPYLGQYIGTWTHSLDGAAMTMVRAFTPVPVP